MVLDYYQDLFTTLAGGETKYEWRMPDWLLANKDYIFTHMTNWDEWFMTYLEYHDIGKPYCREVDSEGKQHFPDHANVSADVWLAVNKDSDPRETQWIGNMIRKDMDMHLLRPSGAEEYAQTNPDTWLLSLIAAFCEIHANASMFGGLESTSFKIKYKNLCAIGKKLFPVKP